MTCTYVVHSREISEAIIPFCIHTTEFMTFYAMPIFENEGYTRKISCPPLFLVSLYYKHNLCLHDIVLIRMFSISFNIQILGQNPLILQNANYIVQIFTLFYFGCSNSTIVTM